MEDREEMCVYIYYIYKGMMVIRVKESKQVLVKELHVCGLRNVGLEVNVGGRSLRASRQH